MDRQLLIVLLGFGIGALSGLFGVGGSSVATPLLRLLAVPRLIALASPLPVTLPTALVAGFAYRRRQAVNLRITLWTALGGIPAVIAGSWLTEVVPGRVLMALTGVLVMATGIRLLRPADETPPAIPPKRPSPWLLIAVGAGVGLLSGLLANGGGFLLMPAYLLLYRMEPREAAVTSLAAVAFLAVPGTWVHWRLGHIDPRLVLYLSAGVLPGAYAGARLGLRLPRVRLRFLFAVLLLLFGTFFLVRTVIRAEALGWLS